MNIRSRASHRTRAGLRGLERAALLVGAVLAAVWSARKRRAPVRVKHQKQATADEKTIRRIAEAQAGGISSAESDARYARGENPGGLHHKAQRPPPDAEGFEVEEPPERSEAHRQRGFPRTMASNRR
jgi:hypothetical protein